MQRFLLALLLLLSSWPILAAGGVEHAFEPSLRHGREHVAAGANMVAIPALGGWHLPPRIDAGGPSGGRDGGSGPGVDAPFQRPVPVVDLGRPPLAEAIARRHGVLFPRYQHLPYYATAPPAP